MNRTKSFALKQHPCQYRIKFLINSNLSALGRFFKVIELTLKQNSAHAMIAMLFKTSILLRESMASVKPI
ncbi:MAG: hypothetical protein ACFCU8_10980 [Thermosynechococcaceae cyanobacterium]